MPTVSLSDLNAFLHTLTEPTYPNIPRDSWLSPGTYIIDDTSSSVSGKFTWHPLSHDNLKLTLRFSPNSDTIPKLFGIDAASEPGEVTERFRVAEGVMMELDVKESERVMEEDDGEGAVFLRARGGMRVEAYKGAGGHRERGVSWIVFVKGVECLVEGDFAGYVV